MYKISHYVRNDKVSIANEAWNSKTTKKAQIACISCNCEDSHGYIVQISTLFELFCFLVIGNFFAVFAILFQKQFFSCIQLIALCNVVTMFANCAGQSNLYSVFSFFWHTSVLLSTSIFSFLKTLSIISWIFTTRKWKPQVLSRGLSVLVVWNSVRCKTRAYKS